MLCSASAVGQAEHHGCAHPAARTEAGAVRLQAGPQDGIPSSPGAAGTAGMALGAWGMSLLPPAALRFRLVGLPVLLP